MKKQLEILLISAILETAEYDFDLIPSGFEAAVSILLKDKGIYEKVPERIIISSEEFKKSDFGSVTTGLTKDIISNFGKSNNRELTYFEDKGVLLYEGLHASAFGKMSYIYRTKGIRLYLLKNKDLVVVTPYCYIDHRGFQLVQELIYKENFENLKTAESIKDIMIHTKPYGNETLTLNRQLILSLTSIKKKFKKAFYLEYLITPPDVDAVSDFSIKVRKKLWDICLSKSFQSNWGTSMQENAINYLSQIGISPSSGQLLKFIKSNSDSSDINRVLERIDILERNLSNQEQDILEFKPNISGIGINGNEIYKRLKLLAYKFNL